ncbi:MAG: DUF1800 family protein [Verrucomicrobiota bacterium]
MHLFRTALSVLALALVSALPLTLTAQEPRLANLSTRAETGPNENVLTAGFVIAPGGSKQLLIRAIGPTLSTFGLSGVVADPSLTVFGPNSSTVVAATNNNWSTPTGTGAATAAQLSAAFTATGAFSLTAGSLDAAVLATLAPGPYTAQVSGAGTSTGLALVEVYEMGATGPKLINISTRARVSTGNSVMIPGVVISAGAGQRRLLVRAAGPSLGALGVTGTLADPLVAVTSSTGTVLASNNNWGTPVGTGAATSAQLSAAFTQVGAFSFSSATSLDAALLIDLPAGNYGIQVTGANATSGLALVEVYDLTATSAAVTVTLSATKTNSNETGTQAGEFTFTRDGSTLLPLTVYYAVSGSASNGLDYPSLLGSIVIPAGSASVTLDLRPLADTNVESSEAVTLTLDTGAGYVIGAQSSGTVTIADNPGTLYVATLRPAPGAIGSAASGLATIVLSASGTIATVDVSFSNLSSPQTVAYLYLGTGAVAGESIRNLGTGQVTGAQWTIQPTANFTSAQILDALRSGQIYVSLETSQYPGGELRGAFLAAIGSQTFTAPAAPPDVALGNLSAAAAARLLTQGTFGPKQSEIDALTGGNVNTWLDAQLALPGTSHRAATNAERAASFADPDERGVKDANDYPFFLRQRAWFQVALTAPDQLRQRVAFALSQILVVSDAAFGQNMTEPTAHYNDMLVNGAFGNFRTLLEQVSLSPVMGLYLSHLRNAKANTTTGTNPDENYAREVMQLFSIGLVQLQPDGTLKLDEQGLPIPTYNQTTISQMARIFTGWAFLNTTANATNNANLFRRSPANYIDPMMLYAVEHEPGTKNLAPVLSTVIPANLGGAEDLKRALDALFNHDNTPAFISRQLIQRLVTDNPSPAYVYRVAEKFRNNGSGTRGDLGAVVRAILTDYEARSTAVIDDPGYGKLKEPLLRYTAFLRAFNATSSSGRNSQNNVSAALAQAPLRAPSVFNFFEPGYVFPGPLAAAGLVAPEFQITDDTTAISVPNFLRTAIFLQAAGADADMDLVPNYSAELALVSNVPALIDRLSLLLTANQLSAAARTRITTTVSALAAGTAAQQLDRVQSAVLLILTSPDGATQR